MPAIAAITTTPIAQREIEVVTRSQTPSQRSSSPGISTLASARFRFATSLSRNMQMKMIVKAARKPAKKSPAMPSTAEIASGTDAETFSAPGLHVLGGAAVAEPARARPTRAAARPSPAGPGGSPAPRRRAAPGTAARSRARRGRCRARSPSPRARATCPSSPSRYRTGYSNTSARKIPMKTIRNVSPIAQNAASTPSVAATSSTVRIGRSNALAGTSPTRVWSERRHVSSGVRHVM